LLGIMKGGGGAAIRAVSAMVCRHEAPALCFREEHGRADEYAVYFDDLGCLHCLT